MDIFIGLKSNHCLVSAWVSKSVKSVRKSSCWHGIVKVFTRIYETWKECPKKKLLIEFRCTQFRTIATLNRSLTQLGVSSSQEGGTRWSVQCSGRAKPGTSEVYKVSNNFPKHVFRGHPVHMFDKVVTWLSRFLPNKIKFKFDQDSLIGYKELNKV